MVWRCVVHGVEVCRAWCGGVIHGVEVCRARCGGVSSAVWRCHTWCGGVLCMVWRCVVHGVEVCCPRCGGVSCTVWRCVVHGVEVCRAQCGGVSCAMWRCVVHSVEVCCARCGGVSCVVWCYLEERCCVPHSLLQALAARLDADSGADTQAELVLKTLRFLLRQWAQELNSQPDAVKRAYQGKIAIATHRQTETYLKPLFKQLKRKVWQPFAFIQFRKHSRLISLLPSHRNSECATRNSSLLVSDMPVSVGQRLCQSRWLGVLCEGVGVC